MAYLDGSPRMTTRSAVRVSLPGGMTLLAFAGVVLVGGANVVAVRFSSEEVPPFFAAAMRFGLAGLLLLVVAFVRKVPTPTRPELVGAILYGLLAFGGSMAFGYWGLQRLPAGVGSVIVATVPLLTLALARIQGLERFRIQGLIGGAVTVAGILVLLSGSLEADITAGGALAMAGAALCFAQAGIVIKRFPPCHPMASNGLAMTIGAVVLLVVSTIADEHWFVLTGRSNWLLMAYMVLIGSVGLFGLYLFVLRGWTASGASYQFVLMPLVAALLGAALLDEPINARFIVGALIVLLGVYVGALSSGEVGPSATPEQEAQAARCATT